MIIDTSAQIAEDFYRLGPAGVPVFLFDGICPAVFDAGFSFLGNKYAKDIQRILTDTTPNRLFLTHCHYDHCGSASVLKKYFPDMVVSASTLSADILKKPNAIKLMTQLNKDAEAFAAKGNKKYPPAEPFQPFEIDHPISGDDVIALGENGCVQVIATPGHTRDHLSYYIPEKKALIAGEAAGIPDATGYIVIDCLVDYDMYLCSVKKLARLDIDILCLGHDYVFTGEDANEYMQRAVDSCEKFLHLVQTCLEDEQGHMESVMKRIRQI